MRCKRVQNQLVAYAEAQLDDSSRLRIEAHLSACESCRTALEALESTRPGPPTPPTHPPEFWAPMHEAILRELEAEPSTANRNHWPIAYFSLMVLVVLWAFRNHDGSEADSTALQRLPPTSSATLLP